jgi:hypothetical protein
MRTASSAQDVLDALDGIAAVAKALGRTYSAVHQWRGNGKFPPGLYLVMTRMLADRGVTAPASLWSMEPPPVAPPSRVEAQQ